MKIYCASSWRNQRITEVVSALRKDGHEVYDFREDDGDGSAFNWTDIDPNWQTWTPEEFRRKLFHHPLAARGFGRDMDALNASESVCLVLPCGRSAHLELGIGVGAQKFTTVLMADGEPELMYKAVDALCLDIEELLAQYRAVTEDHGKVFKREASPISKTRPFGG